MNPLYKKNHADFTDYTDDLTKAGKDALVQKTLAFNQSLTTRFFTSPAFKGSSTARAEMDGIVANVSLEQKQSTKHLMMLSQAAYSLHNWRNL